MNSSRHFSIGSFTRPALLLVSAALVLVASSGCAETQYRGRDITRHVSLRGEPFQGKSASDSATPLIRVKSSAATSEDRAALEAEAKTAFDDELSSNSGAAFRPGVGNIERCRVRVLLKRARSYYVARCRAQWVIDGVVMARVEAEAKRRVRSQVITEDELKGLKKGQRHPGVAPAEARAAIRDAATLAAKLLRDPSADPPRYNIDEQKARDATIAARPTLRGLARADLTHQSAGRRAAAAVDLAQLGERGDGALVAPLLEDESLNVRRAASVALIDLATVDQSAILFRHRNHPDALVQRSVASALERVLALHPETKVPPLGDPPDIGSRDGQPDQPRARADERPARVVIGSEEDVAAIEGAPPPLLDGEAEGEGKDKE